jgi:hypothetical protein
MTCREIDIIVRALHDPYPRPFIVLAGCRIEVFGMQPIDDLGVPEFFVKLPFECKDGVVNLLVRG